MIGNHQQNKRAADSAASETCCGAAIASAAAGLVAWSDSLDAAYAAGLAMGLSQSRAAGALSRERESAARAEGYAEAVAEMQRAERGIASAWREQAEAEAGRWICRGEFRTRATFGAPHPADYLGGPVAWPGLPEAEPRAEAAA